VDFNSAQTLLYYRRYFTVKKPRSRYMRLFYCFVADELGMIVLRDTVYI